MLLQSKIIENNKISKVLEMRRAQGY